MCLDRPTFFDYNFSLFIFFVNICCWIELRFGWCVWSSICHLDPGVESFWSVNLKEMRESNFHSTDPFWISFRHFPVCFGVWIELKISQAGTSGIGLQLFSIQGMLWWEVSKHTEWVTFLNLLYIIFACRAEHCPCIFHNVSLRCWWHLNGAGEGFG